MKINIDTIAKEITVDSDDIWATPQTYSNNEELLEIIKISLPVEDYAEARMWAKILS